MVNCCIEKGVQYGVKNNSKYTGRPYIFKDPNELNILVDCMENRLVLRYKNSIINFTGEHNI